MLNLFIIQLYAEITHFRPGLLTFCKQKSALNMNEQLWVFVEDLSPLPETLCDCDLFSKSGHLSLK